MFPLMALLVSGGHTELNLMDAHLLYKRLGATLDDAAGEAFDKVARLLGLPYPGGPSIQKAAEEGDPNAFKFPHAWLEGTWNFSFSGLKTAVLKECKRLDGKSLPVADLAASFQAAVVNVLYNKTLNAARDFNVKQIVVGGGVSANTSLRDAFLGQGEFPVTIPRLSLCTDNAAMIAAAGYFRYALGHTDGLEIDILPTWPLSGKE
jgi:N6-L-threonylcarbamoyladenine synthase